jgi:hypothetical protein
MKKWLTVLGSLVGALLLAALVTGAVFAQGPVRDGDGVRDLDGEGNGWGRGNGYGLVDEDGEGVLNRSGSNGEFVDEDGDGLCDICGEVLGESHTHEWGYARGNGYGLVDEDGEGVLNRSGSNGEFVDEDGDGLCDTHGVAAAEGNGPQFRTELETEQTPMARRGGFARRAVAQ